MRDVAHREVGRRELHTITLGSPSGGRGADLTVNP
jgi:hypothetical protein